MAFATEQMSPRNVCGGICVDARDTAARGVVSLRESKSDRAANTGVRAPTQAWRACVVGRKCGRFRRSR